MAVYTKLSENQLKEFFLKYNLGKLLDYKEIREGIENTNYFIQTEKGKFILTLYEKRVEGKDLPFFMGLMKNIFNENFPSPEPILNKNGNYITEIFGKKGIITELFKKIGNLNQSQRKEYASKLNDLKAKVTKIVEKKLVDFDQSEINKKLKNEKIDITLPGRTYFTEKIHTVSQVIDEATTILAEIGFSVEKDPM